MIALTTTGAHVWIAAVYRSTLISVASLRTSEQLRRASADMSRMKQRFDARHAAATMAEALGGTRRDPDATMFEVDKATYAYRFDTASGLLGQRDRVTWSEIVVPLHRYPLVINLGRRGCAVDVAPFGKGWFLEAAPRSAADVVVNEVTVEALGSLGAFSLHVAADSDDPRKRFVKLRFVGWAVDSRFASSAIRLVTAIAGRIPHVLRQAEEASETVDVSRAPFRKCPEIMSRRDVMSELFTEVRQFRRQRLRRTAISVAGALIIFIGTLLILWICGT
jgi:hypothetical protein